MRASASISSAPTLAGSPDPSPATAANVERAAIAPRRRHTAAWRAESQSQYRRRAFERHRRIRAQQPRRT